MKVSGTRMLEAPRPQVWEVLNDPRRMAESMPHVESFEVQDDRHWKANVKIPLGLGGLQMSIKFEKTEEREPEYARLHAKGTGVGALLSLDTQFHLAEEGLGTAMRWEAEVSIAGPVGSMGQRVLQPIVNQQVQQVLGALEQQVQAAAAPPGAPAAQTVEGAAPPEMRSAQTPPQESSSGGGAAGAAAPTPAAHAETDPDLKDYGPPADSSPEREPDAGSSGAEEGLNPWAPESYSSDPDGPTTSTRDPD
jgi:carbon monoxide dehydrogenase subunit G